MNLLNGVKNIHSCILILLLLSPQSKAQMPIVDPEDTMILAGKGLIERKTQSWIALKCISSVENPETLENCESFRHVYYNSEKNELQEIGPMIPNDQNLKTSLKKLGKGFKAYLNIHTNRQFVRVCLLAGLTITFLIVPMFLSTGAAPLITGSTAANIQVFGGLPLMFGVTPTLGNNPDKGIVMVNTMNKPLQDRDGWNWSIQPKKIRKKIFKHYITYIKNLKSI